MHAQASATATTPVATVSTVDLERAVAVLDLAMTATLSSRGSPSSQCAARGSDFTTAVHLSTSVSRRMAASRELVITPMAHVPLSAGSVRTDTLP